MRKIGFLYFTCFLSCFLCGNFCLKEKDENQLIDYLETNFFIKKNFKKKIGFNGLIVAVDSKPHGTAIGSSFEGYIDYQLFYNLKIKDNNKNLFTVIGKEGKYWLEGEEGTKKIDPIFSPLKKVLQKADVEIKIIEKGPIYIVFSISSKVDKNNLELVLFFGRNDKSLKKALVYKEKKPEITLIFSGLIKEEGNIFPRVIKIPLREMSDCYFIFAIEKIKILER